MSYGSNFGLGFERKKRLPHSGSQVSMLTPVTFLIAETAQNPVISPVWRCPFSKLRSFQHYLKVNLAKFEIAPARVTSDQENEL